MTSKLGKETAKNAFSNFTGFRDPIFSENAGVRFGYRALVKSMEKIGTL